MYHHQNSKHPFHLVDVSPWPLFTALSIFVVTSSGVMYMHSYQKGGFLLFLGFLLLILNTGLWWRDVIREATFEGQHTFQVQAGLRMGMLLFIISEIMFFVAFFWAFFHASLAPTPQIGAVWPPLGIEILNPWELPLLNTLILLLSGAAVTWAHHALIHSSKRQALIGLAITIILSVIFTTLQGYEYMHANFSINDSVYGSTFYLATGFHGTHVIIGTLFLAVCLYRIAQSHLTREHHAGFEFAILYWHFVDVVWLFLFISIYWWGS